MRIQAISHQYSNKHFYQNKLHNNSNINFNGRTNFYAFTDIHQNAEKHCKMVYEIIKKAANTNDVILDNGDIFKGLFPKYTLMHTYTRAKIRHPELEIVYNIGNNDPGFMETDRLLFKKYLNTLQNSGIKTISCNIIDETTGLRPEGVKPYTIVERDGDKLCYIGFVVNKLKQKFAGLTSIDPLTALENIAPELKKVMKENKCKGLVMMVHDTEEIALKLNNRAKELGLQPEFILGGHVHHPYYNKTERIIYPEPFGKSMTTFSLDIEKDVHKLSQLHEIPSEECEIGIYKKLIEKAKENEKFNEKIAKSVTELKFKYPEEFHMEYSQLGALYADGIKGLTNSDIGFVPKSWMYDTLPQKDGYITKLDILLSCPQPYRNIVQVKMTPEELRNFYQYDIEKKSRLFDASRNFWIDLDRNKNIKQIYINGKALFHPDGSPISPNKTLTIAIDAHTAESIPYEKTESKMKMYDGIVYGLKQIENETSADFVYPTAKLRYV